MALADYWNGKKGENFCCIVQEYWCTGSEVQETVVMELDLAAREIFQSADNTFFCFVNRELDGVVLKFKWLTKHTSTCMTAGGVSLCYQV
jgi:hypothetical protein